MEVTVGELSAMAERASENNQVFLAGALYTIAAAECCPPQWAILGKAMQQANYEMTADAQLRIIEAKAKNN